GTSGTWPGKNRWNRWEGRIVLVAPVDAEPMITVKVQGVDVTLKSTGPVSGLGRRPQVWDEVNIAVDPEKVKLVLQTAESSPRRFDQIGMGGGTLAGPHVWLKGLLQAVHEVSSGWLLSLEIGGAHVSALVSLEAIQEISWARMPGEQVEVHVDQWDAWVKPSGAGAEPIPCRLLQLS
ncbi:MAG: hypothetical protein ACREIE_09440, partial [Nitrospiraceae bacterium]